MKESREIYKTKHKLKSLALKCTNCGHNITGDEVNINSTLAKCSNCQNVMFLEDDTFFGGVRGRPEMIIPEGTEIINTPSSLDIQVKWSKSGGGFNFMTFFTVAWNLMLLPFAIALIASGNFGGLLPMAAHLAVGLGLLYHTMKMFINYSDVYITDDRITIEQKPLSWFSKDISISTRDVKQLFVSRYVSSTTNGQANYAYGLHAVLKNGKNIKLIKGLNKETQLYLEQEIERFLDIDDESVRGEVPKANE